MLEGTAVDAERILIKYWDITEVFVAHIVHFTFKHGIAWIGYGLEAWREFCEDFLLYH